MVTLALAAATTVGMIDGVHGGTSDMRALAEPSSATSFTEVGASVEGVADGADDSRAVFVKLAHFARGQAHLSIVACDSNHGGGRASRATEEARAVGSERNGMDGGGCWNRVQRQSRAGRQGGCTTEGIGERVGHVDG